MQEKSTRLAYGLGIALVFAAQAMALPVMASQTATTASDQIIDESKVFDPCTKQIIDKLPASANRPKALDLVKDRDPELFKQIQAKVADPRYTGRAGQHNCFDA